ncbi:MAG: GAF domain-containing protein [Myxococcota bacterium]|nr:GAF domain-containing protein [Myxococcota bacterium]
MPLFSVTRRGQPSVTVNAANWIVAMGEAIPKLAGDVAIDRLACEMLVNGTVIARDVRSGVGYVILPLAASAKEPDTETSEQTANEALDAVGEPSEPEDEDSLDSDSLEERLQEIRDAERATGAWELALDLAAELISVEAASAVEATPRAGLLFAAVKGEQASKLRALRLPYGAGFVGVCVDQGLRLRVNDVDQDSRHYTAVDEATGFHTRNVLCVPVLSEKLCYGCLQMLNAGEGRFTGRDAELVTRVADVLAERLLAAKVGGRLRRSD